VYNLVSVFMVLSHVGSVFCLADYIDVVYEK
jgi:hypothetical protein